LISFPARDLLFLLRGSQAAFDYLRQLSYACPIPVIWSTVPVMWSSIPASGPPFRYTFKNGTNSHRNAGPDPTGIADHFPPESMDQLRRNPQAVIQKPF
jgi:hypothetical protein